MKYPVIVLTLVVCSGTVAQTVPKRELRAVWIATAMNMTVPGIIAHDSALKNGELLKIPQYEFEGVKTKNLRLDKR